MRRIQAAGPGPFAPRDPEDEKRRARESTLSSLLIFGLVCGLIKTGTFST